VEAQVSLGVRLEAEPKAGPLPASARVQVLRLDRGWSSDVVSLEGGGGLLQLSLVANKPNEFEIRLTDKQGGVIPCEPERITILQGIKIDDPPLPFDICVEACTTQGDRLVPVLRKGQQLPATGVVRGLRTRCDLRPDVARDIVSIPVYEGEAGTRAIHNRWLGELHVTGTMVASRVPAGAEVEVTISMDSSRRKTVSAFVAHLDETFEEVMAPLQKTHVDPTVLQISLADANGRLEHIEEALANSGNGRAAAFRLSLDEAEQACDSDKEAGLERLRELHRELDGYEKEMAGALAAGERSGELDRIAREVSVHGNPEDRSEFASVREGTEAAIATLDSQAMDRAIRRCRDIYWRILYRRPDFWMGSLYRMRSDYGVTHWSDKERAASLLAQAEKFSAGGYKPELNSMVRELWRLQPEGEGEGRREDILERVGSR
jgi:molecular chaperone DnaK